MNMHRSLQPFLMPPIYNQSLFASGNATVAPVTQDVVQKECLQFLFKLKKEGRITSEDCLKMKSKILLQEDKRIPKAFDTLRGDLEEFIEMLPEFLKE